MSPKPIPVQPFGQTGHQSSRLIFGAVALSGAPQEKIDRTLDLLFEYGINHIDTAASYGDSELKLGPWMERYRDRFFLATKTGDRTYNGAKESIHRSLERLRLSAVDLIQLHYLVDPQEWDTAMGPEGALEALIEAREQGLTRFIGVTGHDIPIPEMHQKSLARFPFDSVLLPYNWIVMQNPRYAHHFEQLMGVCKERGIAVQTIKALASGAWGDAPHTSPVWYRPFSEQAQIDKAVHWVLGREGFFLNTVGDLDLLPKVLDAAARFERRPTEEEMRVAMANAQPLFT